MLKADSFPSLFYRLENTMRKNKQQERDIRVGDRVDYKAVVSAVNESIVIMQDGKIVFANPAFNRLTGKSIPEIIGASFVDFVSSNDTKHVMERVKDIGKQRGRKSQIEFHLHAKHIKPVLVDMDMCVIGYGGRNAILGWLTDITERRQKTLETQRLQKRLRNILDSMRHVILSFSFSEPDDEVKVRDAAFFDAHLVETNPAAEALYDVPIEEFLAKKRSIFDFIHEEDREKVLRHYQNLEAEGSGEVTYRVTRPDNEVRWVLDYGKVEYRENKRVRRLNRFIEDITSKTKALEELNASEKKYRRVFERSKDMIYVLEPDGSFIDINPAGVELLWLESKEAAVRRNIKEFFVDPRSCDAFLMELMEKGTASYGREMLRNNRGEIIEVDLNGSARRDVSGKAISYHGIVTNISEALRWKELESIGQLAGCFADDLASPLSTIMMNLSIAEDTITDLKKNMDKCTEADKALNMDDVGKEIHHHFEEIVDSMNSSMSACKDIAVRLKEIREEYWRLRKVSDGTGGIIYERRNKRPPDGNQRLARG
jgi:PAS domain S-box-containing protein